MTIFNVPELTHDLVILVALLVLVPIAALALSIYGETRRRSGR